MALTISVILPTHDRPDSLRRCVRSLLLQDRPPLEIILVNDGRVEIPGDVPADIRAAGVAAACIRQRLPSLPAARNAGLAAARGDILLLVDDDHELPRDYLHRLARLYEADTDGRVDAVCGMVVEPARPRRRKLWDRLMTLAGHLRWRPRRCVARSRPLPPALAGVLRPTRYLTGGATSMRRAVAERIAYDAGLGGYALGEDREFSYRATQRFAVFMAPSLLMLHHCEPSARPTDREYGRMIAANYVRIARNSIEPGCGKWFVLGWNLAGLCLAHAAYALVGSRRYHADVLAGMAGQIVRELLGCALRLADPRPAPPASLPPGPAQPDRPRVLLLFSRFEAGGAERIALDLMRQWKQEGRAVGAAAVYGGGAWADQFASVSAFFRDGLAAGKYDVSSIVRVRQFLRRCRVDTLLIVDAVKNAIISGLAGADLADRPVRKVLWCHACPGHQASGRMAGFVDRVRRCAHRLDSIVCVADWQRRELERLGVPGQKMLTVENGVDLSRFHADVRLDKASLRRDLNLPPDAFLLVQVANYWPEKDPAWLLTAFAQARASAGSNLHLALVGRGMDAPEIRASVERLGVGGAVTLAGYRDDVPRWLAAADAFVLASAHETQSIAAIEAMAARLPLLVADIPGFSELVQDGRTGLKCPPGQADALARCILRLAGDAALRARLADAASASAARFDLARTARRMADLL